MPDSSSPAAVRFCALALALAALASSCTSAGGTPDAGPDTAAALPCSTDAECAESHMVCDRHRRTCVCTKDAMCAGNPEGAYCNAFTGRCVQTIAGCHADSECASGEFCDAALRTCRAKHGWCEACTQDEECGGPADNCIHYTDPTLASLPAFCGIACGDGDACPQGQKCALTEKGRQCIPQVGRCNQSGACEPDTGQHCGSDVDCTQGEGQVCERVLQRCIASATTCRPDQACDPITRSCVAACATDLQCVERYGPTFSCRNRACVSAQVCTDDVDCDALLSCYKEPGSTSGSGICKPSCGTDTDCPLGQLCETSGTSGRRKCIDGCLVGNDATCPLNAICGGEATCEYATAAGVRRCQVKDVCNFREYCTNNACVPATDHCRAIGSGCGAGHPVTIYKNVQCGATTCPAGVVPQCGAVPGCPGNGCGCPVQRCLYDCATDAQCPKGFECSTLGSFRICSPVDPNLCP